MIYGVEAQNTARAIPAEPAGPHTVAATVQSQEAISLTSTKLLGRVVTVASSEVVQLATSHIVATTTPKAITIATPHSLQLTATNIGQIIIAAGGTKSSARLLQPGNLQAGQRMRINWQHPLAGGLVYLEMFDQLHSAANDYPLMPAFIGSHGALTRDAPTSMSIRAGPGGVGYSSAASNTAMRATSGNLVRVPQSKGSYFAYVTADFNANDSLSHYITVIGRETASTEQYFALFKFTDNNTYFGWVTNNVNYRAVVASSGLWSSGDTFMIGGTWNSSNVNCFVKGKLAGSLGSAPTPGNTTTATAVYRFANSSSTGQAWGTVAGKNNIYYVAMWDRDLSTAECNYLNQNPYCFLTPASSRP